MYNETRDILRTPQLPAERAMEDGSQELERGARQLISAFKLAESIDNTFVTEKNERMVVRLEEKLRSLKWATKHGRDDLTLNQNLDRLASDESDRQSDGPGRNDRRDEEPLYRDQRNNEASSDDGPEDNTQYGDGHSDIDRSSIDTERSYDWPYEEEQSSRRAATPSRPTRPIEPARLISRGGPNFEGARRREGAAPAVRELNISGGQRAMPATRR